jgi:hypothetical protein
MVQHGDTQNKNLFLVQHGDTQNKNQVCLFSWYNMGIHKIKSSLSIFLVQHGDTQTKINFVYFLGTIYQLFLTYNMNTHCVLKCAYNTSYITISPISLFTQKFL